LRIYYEAYYKRREDEKKVKEIGFCPHCGEFLPIEYHAGSPCPASICPQCGKSTGIRTITTNNTDEPKEFLQEKAEEKRK
jgi:ribosomal protein L32